MPLPKTLKALRKEHGLSQSQAAHLVSVTPRSWARYEAGDRIPAEGILELFCLKIGRDYKKTFSKDLQNV